MLTTQTYTADFGRDKGKVFILTELAARPAHRWATRVLFAVMNTGIELPADILESGMAGVAQVGIKALGAVPYDIAEPMLDELLGCVTWVPDPARPEIARPLRDDAIQEAATYFKLQHAVMKLHTDPFTRGDQSTSVSMPISGVAST